MNTFIPEKNLTNSTDNPQEVWLFGDFNGWNKFEFPLERLQYGKWEIKLKPNKEGECKVPHLSKLKLAIKTPSGEVVDRLNCFMHFDA